MDMLRKIKDLTKNNDSNTVMIEVEDRETEKAELAQLKEKGYVLNYSVEEYFGTDYWSCTLGNKKLGGLFHKDNPTLPVLVLVIALVIGVVAFVLSTSGSDKNSDKCSVCGGSGLVNTGFVDFETCPVCKGSGVDFH